MLRYLGKRCLLVVPTLLGVATLLAALIVALLEDKPVVIFDEWAADQDPSFRRKFYEEILPELKAKGKVVICVTHDDRYFDVADHRFKMEFGRMVA